FLRVFALPREPFCCRASLRWRRTIRFSSPGVAWGTEKRPRPSDSVTVFATPRLAETVDYRLWDLRIPLDLLGVDGVEERGQGIGECLALGAMRLGGVDVCDEVGAESAQEEFPGKGRTGPILFAGRFGYV